MARYLSMLKTEIRQFVSTQRYGSLLEMQEAAKRREIEIELQIREVRADPAQSQPIPKRFRTTDSRAGSKKGRTFGKCGKVHDGVCRSSSGCHKCGKQGHITRDYRQQTPASSVRRFYHCKQVGHMKAHWPVTT